MEWAKITDRFHLWDLEGTGSDLDGAICDVGLGGVRKRPRAFNEHGEIKAGTARSSPGAVKVSGHRHSHLHA